MKKTYIAPTANCIQFNVEGMIAQSGGGVSTGGKVGNEYKSTDESYSNRRNGIWGNED